MIIFIPLTDYWLLCNLPAWSWHHNVIISENLDFYEGNKNYFIVDVLVGMHYSDTLWLQAAVYCFSLCSGGDESQVALAIVLASSVDCAVYGCTINNEYGSDTTDFLLSEDGMYRCEINLYLTQVRLKWLSFVLSYGRDSTQRWPRRYAHFIWYFQ